MNLQIYKTCKPSSRHRTGVTIVEVLTSIIVAVIGVAGVLVLIPFGIRQAQTGLDLYDTTTLAENSLQEFQIRGYATVARYQDSVALPWINLQGELVDGMPADAEDSLELVKLETVEQDPTGWFLIDPLWCNAMTTAVASTDSTVAPFNYPHVDRMVNMFNYVGTNPVDATAFINGVPQAFDPTLFDVPPFLPRFVHLLDLSNPFADASTDPPIANPIQLGMTDRIFRSRDNLQFAVEKDPETGAEIEFDEPPIPYLDRDAVNGVLRRQFEGSVSWSAVAVPKRQPGNVDLLGDTELIEGFEFHVLVYKDRSFENPTPFAAGTSTADPELDPRFIYTTVIPYAPDLEQRITNTGTVFLDAPAVDISNDEWVMLINYELESGLPQVGFYRVIGSTPDNPATVALDPAITLDGSDFTVMDFLNGDPSMPNRSATYVIYLPDVVNVFKRQLNLEQDF